MTAVAERTVLTPATDMRGRFCDVTTAAVDRDPRVAVVLADISVDAFRRTGAIARHPTRVVNIGIREAAMVGVAAGLALTGHRPVIHTYAPFVVERAFEQLKLDLGHQGVGAVCVTIGASYDAAPEGRTHQAPGDVALIATLPGWTVRVPGHPDEVEELLAAALAGDDRVYLRLSEELNAAPVAGARDGRVVVVREASAAAPLVVAVGPTLDPVLAACADRDVRVAYTATPHPLDAVGLRAAAGGDAVVLVEPYLTGTGAAALLTTLADRPRRLLCIGVDDAELRRYGTGADHRRAHGLDAAGIRRSLDAFLR